MTEMLTEPRAAPTAPPPLREGDRMDADEFVRRWQAMPEPRPKCELLEGEVHFMSPIFEATHSGPHFHLLGLLFTYCVATPGTYGGGPGSLRLSRRDMPEPDGYLRVLESHGGQSRRGADGCIEGMPELVIEIAGASLRQDLGAKFRLYRRRGVQEYLIWRTEQSDLDLYHRDEQALDPVEPDEDGLLRSVAFPGLWLNVAALLRGDLAAALASLQLGLASPEHSAFVEQLRQRAAASAASAAPASPAQASPAQTSPAQATPAQASPTEGARS